MIKDKFNLHFTYEITAGTTRSKVEMVDFTGEYCKRLNAEGSWFGSWLDHNDINYKDLDEEAVGRYLLDFFNSTLRPWEARREFVKIEILQD